MVNEKKLDEVMKELGHDESLIGTGYIREAVKMRDAGAGRMCKDVYPGIASAHHLSWAAVEHSMRHSLEKAWGRCPEGHRNRYFGTGVYFVKGRPALGEYVATLARICREGLDV